jgi:hypothetical protein
MEDMFHIQVEDKIFGEDWLECFATEILDVKYDKADVAEVVKGFTHLNAHQKADLLQVLQENNKIFDGTLGVCPHKKVHNDINPNAKPVTSNPFEDFQKGTRPSCQTRCSSSTTRKWMGITLIHYSKERWQSMLD